MMKVETPDPEADEVCAGIIRCRAKNSEALALGRWCARSALPRNGGRGEILTGDSLCSHKNNGRNYPAVVFVMMKVETPDPRLNVKSRLTLCVAASAAHRRT